MPCFKYPYKFFNKSKQMERETQLTFWYFIFLNVLLIREQHKNTYHTYFTFLQKYMITEIMSTNISV